MSLYIKQKGSVNYTIVGSPTIVDGVVTEFNNGYFSIANFQFHTSNTFEIVINASTQLSQSQNQQRLISISSSFYLRTVVNTDWSVYVSGSTYSASVSTEDYPFVKLVKKSGDLLDFYVSTDGISYILKQENIDVSGISDGTITFGASGNDWLGTLNFNNTYIKVDGQAWFGVCPVEVQKHQLKGPVGYTVVGSPTITNGVLSNTSSSDYLQSSDTPNTINNIEFNVKFTVGSDIFQNAAFIGYNTSATGTGNLQGACTTTSNGRIRFYLFKKSDNTNPVFEISGYDLRQHLGETFTVNCFTDKSTVKIKLYDSANNLVASNDYTSQDLVGNITSKIMFGRNISGNTALGNNLLNLNETYIKVNGKLWYWQPRETERIVVNGVQVWQKP